MEIASAGAGDRTECDDPAAPAAPGGVDGPNLVANPGFASGLPPWGTFGQIVWQVAGEVFEFYRPAGTPAGVILQSLQQAADAGEILTAAFELGNSSPVRKRVTVILHDVDFSDLHACTFFLAPGTPLSGYTMRTYATEAWQNATVSVYAATVGTDQWIRLDNVSVQRTPGTAPMGTECLEPAGDLDPVSAPATSSINSIVTASSGAPVSDRASAGPPGAALVIATAIELDADVTTLAFEARGPERAVISIQIAANGDSWMTIGVVMPSDEWTSHAIDLRPFAHGRVWLRFVEDLRGATAPQTVEYRRVEIR
jgi:hypothetical protein